MAALPDELWIQILWSGVRNGQLHHRDLCTLAIVCHRLSCISGSDCLWRELASQEFPEAGVELVGKLGSEKVLSDWKRIYKLRFEKVRDRRIAGHRRQVLRVGSSLLAMQRESLDLQMRLRAELDKLVLFRKELENLDSASRASAALQIWQPRAVSTQHQQVVEQIPVNIVARRNNLHMELRVCKAHIQCIQNTLESHKLMIEQRQKELDILKYNPIQDDRDNKALLKDIRGRKRKLTLATKHPFPNSKTRFCSQIWSQISLLPCMFLINCMIYPF